MIQYASQYYTISNPIIITYYCWWRKRYLISLRLSSNLNLLKHSLWLTKLWRRMQNKIKSKSSLLASNWELYSLSRQDLWSVLEDITKQAQSIVHSFLDRVTDSALRDLDHGERESLTIFVHFRAIRIEQGEGANRTVGEAFTELR
jgi:hypothetical protein